MEKTLVNEYIELHKRAFDISDEEWKYDSLFKPLKKAIENTTDELLVRKISKLKQWMKEKRI